MLVLWEAGTGVVEAMLEQRVGVRGGVALRREQSNVGNRKVSE